MLGVQVRDVGAAPVAPQVPVARALELRAVGRDDDRGDLDRGRRERRPTGDTRDGMDPSYCLEVGGERATDVVVS